MYLIMTSYQPEAYLPSSDTYIEKDLAINEEIDKLRLAADLCPAVGTEGRGGWCLPCPASTVWGTRRISIIT